MDKSIALITGSFNILHPGHIKLLKFSKDFGEVVVGLKSDVYLYEKYGKHNTILMKDRLLVLNSCIYVDRVIVYNEKSPIKLIEKIKPNFYIKGPNYKNVDLPEDNILNILGIKKIIQPDKKQYSSEDIVQSFSIKSLNFFNS